MPGWIAATQQQRAVIVAIAARKAESNRKTQSHQNFVAVEIKKLQDAIAAKQAELENGGFARRLNRQIGDLEQELAIYQADIR